MKYAKKRLDETLIEIDDINSLTLEIKPPKVPMEKLLKFGYLKIGQKIYNKSKKMIGTIENNGHINDGEDILSIHKMSAKHLGISNNNGWDYFWIKKNNKEFVKLDSLRYEFQKEQS